MNNENCLQLIDISYGIIQQQTNKNRFTKLTFKYMTNIFSPPLKKNGYKFCFWRIISATGCEISPNNRKKS